MVNLNGPHTEWTYWDEEGDLYRFRWYRGTGVGVFFTGYNEDGNVIEPEHEVYYFNVDFDEVPTEGEMAQYIEQFIEEMNAVEEEVL